MMLRAPSRYHFMRRQELREEFEFLGFSGRNARNPFRLERRMHRIPTEETRKSDDSVS
jgi:hypothetical protein